MITLRKDGFYQVENQADVPCIGIETERLPTCIEGIKQLEAKGVFGSPYHGFHTGSLSFLKELPQIEAIVLRDTTLDDLDGLFGLKKLRHFQTNHRRPPIDFTQLPSLEKAVIEPVSLDKNLDALDNLKSLHLWNYRPRTKDLTLLPPPKSIEELSLNWVSITSLSDLPELPQLKTLIVRHCKNLTDLALPLDRLPHLERFVVHACIKLPESELERAASDYSHLKSVEINEENEH